MKNRLKEVDTRILYLKRLQINLHRFEQRFYEAFKKDLGKGPDEVYLTEIGVVNREISLMIRNVRRWSRPTPVWTPLVLPGRTSTIYKEAKGKVLIIGPYNYPLQLVLMPLVGAIAAGNTVVVKPSELTPNVSTVIRELLNSVFDDEIVSVVEGGVDVTKNLLKRPYSLVFFTGSKRVGHEVMKQAAETMTPVILELGGKSPVIVTETADIERTAYRIVWGKFLNAGQTCVAPDYVLVHRSKYRELVLKLNEEIISLYGHNIEINSDYSRIVNEKNAQRLANIIESHRDAIIFGGTVHGRYIEPTLIELIQPTGIIMEEEIFGPILPIIPYDTREEMLEIIDLHPNPLAAYFFTDSRKEATDLINSFSFGGGMVNDAILHLSNENLPFGGIGESGIGNYHGKRSFDLFSHEKSIMRSSKHIHLKIMMPPYTKFKRGIIKKIM